MVRIILLSLSFLIAGALAYDYLTEPVARGVLVRDFDQKQVAFSSALPLRENRQVAVLTSDWEYCHPPTGEIYKVPRGYITDYASVPWFSKHAGFSEFGPHKFAALIHDWLYSVGEGKGTEAEERYRKKADKIFLDALQQSGAGYLTRRAMFRAVRLGGAQAYGSDQEWRDRFALLDDNNTIRNDQLASPPFARPTSAVIDTVEDCAEWQFNKKRMAAEQP